MQYYSKVQMTQHLRMKAGFSCIWLVFTMVDLDYPDLLSGIYSQIVKVRKLFGKSINGFGHLTILLIIIQVFSVCETFFC